MARYENYIFDLYGTLIDIWTDENDPALWRIMAEIYSRSGADYTPDALRIAYKRIAVEEQEKLGMQTGYRYPEIRLETVFLRLLKEAPVRHRTEINLRSKKDLELWLRMIAGAFRSVSMRRFRLFPGVKDVLTAVRAQGAQLFLLSNAQRIFTLPEMEMTGIVDYFDDIYISSDHGMAKPEIAFMEKLLTDHQLDPSRCVMIGNDWNSDMALAAKCGVDGVFLNSDHYRESEIRAGLPKGRFSVIQSGNIIELLS